MLNSSYLKELMMEHGMSLGQLSVRTGISKSQLSRILSGERGIGAKTIKGLKNEKELLANQLKVMMKEHEIGIAGDQRPVFHSSQSTSESFLSEMAMRSIFSQLSVNLPYFAVTSRVFTISQSPRVTPLTVVADEPAT